MVRGFQSFLLFDCFFKAIIYTNLQIPNLTSAIILPQWCQFAAMETVTSWGCLADEKFQVIKKQWGSDTLLQNTDPVWFSVLVLNWTEIMHCRRNIPFWIEREYLGLCVFCMSANSAIGQDNFFLNQQSRESKRQLQQVVDSICGEQCSLEIPSLLGCRRILGACFSCQSVDSSSQLGSFRCLWQAQITDRPDTGPVGDLQDLVTSRGHLRWPYKWATESGPWWLI